LNILFTLEKGLTRERYFPPEAMEDLAKLGNLMINDSGRPFTEAEMADRIGEADICLTHWNCPAFTHAVLERAGKLRLIAHAAGSVAYMVTDEVYERGIKVCSSNRVMARYVAEGTLAYMLAGLRMIPQHDRLMKSGRQHERLENSRFNLIHARIGMIGLGTVGRFLLDLLRPFDVRVRLYDPYLDDRSLKNYPFVETCSLEEALAWGDIVTVHASLTPETRHMLDTGKLRLIRDGALFVNTARGAIVDETALTDELVSGRINAVLDVFEDEYLSMESPLRRIGNAILMPHMAYSGGRRELTWAMIGEIGRFIRGEPLEYEIPFEKYRLMTRGG
jgi:phosphoglycerate dehydrogenase-like enzyme